VLKSSEVSEAIVIGGGARGLYFVRMLTQSLGVRVAGVVDREQQHDVIRYRLKEFGTESTRLFTTADEAFSAIPASKAGIVFIMTPDWTHYDIFRKSVDAGRHIFIEKPLATQRKTLFTCCS
jgi:predicted dehydrogenase